MLLSSFADMQNGVAGVGCKVFRIWGVGGQRAENTQYPTRNIE